MYWQRKFDFAFSCDISIVFVTECSLFAAQTPLCGKCFKFMAQCGPQYFYFAFLCWIHCVKVSSERNVANGPNSFGIDAFVF